jgi:hypothetical protein
MNTLLKLLLTIFLLTGCIQRNYNVKENESNKNYSSDMKSESTRSFKKEIINLAIIFPSVTIGQYALEATNSINTYLMYKDEEFKLSVYDIIVQNKNNLINVIEIIKAKKINRVIAMITKEDLIHLSNISDISHIKFYFPLINKDNIINYDKFENLDLTFGAISYKDQFEKLIEYASDKTLVEFYGDSVIGRTLHEYLSNKTIKYTKKIDDKNGKYKNFLEDNEKFDNSVVLLNTPIIKSSILLSAINSQELNISKILSTQLNYTPLLFSLTQTLDREKLVIANSIGEIPKYLEEYDNLIGNSLSYSWVNYSTIVGIEYLLNNNVEIFKNLSLKNNQIIYPVNLYTVGDHSFKLIK